MAERHHGMAGGRPLTYNPDFHPEFAYKLALLGHTDAEIAKFFEVTEQTVNNWKKYPEFFESLNRGKIIADSDVNIGMYKRATGMVTKEVVYEDIEERIDHGDGTWHYEPKTRVKTSFKEEAPNVTAGIFWMKNRQPGKWRDKQEIQHSVTEPQTFSIGGQEISFS